MDKARAIYEWVVDHTFRNPKTRGCGLGDIRFMLETGDLSGKCADLNTLYVGLARAAGLPAPDVYGIRVAKSQLGFKSLGASSEYVTKAQHCRGEVYLDEYGWIPVDPAERAESHSSCIRRPKPPRADSTPSTRTPSSTRSPREKRRWNDAMTRAYLALLALAACSGCAQPTPSVAPGFPTIAFTDPEPPSILDVPAARMPETLKQHYVLRPDRRFLGAVAEMHRLVSGNPADTVRVSRQGEHWIIAYAGERVGDLPDLPGFEDASALLQGWAERLVQRYPLDTAGGPSGRERDTVAALLARLNAPQLGAALRVVDAGWRRGRHPGWLPLAASGLVLLAIQLPKEDVVGDPLVARALATTALAGAVQQGDAVAQARALLAEHMGYTHEAARLTAGLPPGHPVRFFVTRDRASLRSAATDDESSPLTRHLYVSAIADLSDSHAFREALDALGVRRPSSGTLGAAVTTSRFETDAMVIPLMPPTLAAELAPFTRRSYTLYRLVRALGRLLGGRALSRVVGWDDVLQADAGSGGGDALARFEGDLAALDARVGGGPFLNGDMYALYFRAQLHAAFERACIHYVDGLASVRASAAFVGAFDDAPPGLWEDVARWCRGRAAVDAGHGSVDSLLDALRTVRGLSEPALRRSLDDIGELLRYTDERHAAAARTAFARLDSRPHALRLASQVATDRLGDVPLAERLDQRLLAVAGVDYPELTVWAAHYRGDARALAAQARDRSLALDARFNALKYLLGITADTPATFTAFERLLAEDPDNWDERRRYVDMLVEARRVPDAVRVTRSWLATHGADRGFDHIFASIKLAVLYQRMGRLQEAYALLQPLQDSYQLGVLQRSALIALASGRVDDADDLAQRVVDRYPGSPDARTTLAEVLWAQRRYEAVPVVLNDSQHPLSPADWRHVVGPAFARAFGRRASAIGDSAFDALARGGIPATLLGTIPAAAADSGFFPLALVLKQRLLPPAGGDDAEAVEFYRYLVAARGAGAGRAWLAARWSPLEARRQALSIYRNGLYDLLWELNAVPDEGAEGSYYWLVRTLAWLEDPKRNPTRRAQLMAFYRRPDARFYHLAGRCLLGLEPDATLLPFASTPHRRAEVSYYLGIKALSERRYRDASDWLRVTVETQSVRDWELLWAKDLLTRWSGAGRELRVAVPRVAAKAPTW